MFKFAELAPRPYYAVIFSNQASLTPEGYAEMSQEMQRVAETMPGYLGMESARDQDGFAITVSYWQDEEAIKGWRAHVKHQLAQKIGRERWYAHYKLRVCKIERQYDGP